MLNRSFVHSHSGTGRARVHFGPSVWNANSNRTSWTMTCAIPEIQFTHSIRCVLHACMQSAQDHTPGGAVTNLLTVSSHPPWQADEGRTKSTILPSSLSDGLRTCIDFKIIVYFKAAIHLILASNTPPTQPHAGDGGWGHGLAGGVFGSSIEQMTALKY
jgi:hypothetical protein